MNQARQIAAHLLASGAVQLKPDSPFTWASGLKSPIYCDNRVLLSFPDERKELIEAFAASAKNFGQLDGIAGVATAGIAHGALLADRLNLPFIYVRAKAKSHGRQNLIEGQLTKGFRYLVIEDLISTGGSAIQACEAIRQAGGEVAGALAIFTYELPKADLAFDQAGIKFETLSNYSSLIALANEQKTIGAQEAESLREWRNNPEAWSAKFENV
ncbi:MAG: orotate phosphoribosyltransferase [Bacteroidota bacterium]